MAKFKQKLFRVGRGIKKRPYLLIILGFINVIFFAYIYLPLFLPVIPNADVDYINSGKYEGGLLISEYSRVVVWNLSQNRVEWEYSGDERGLHFVHDADLLPNDNLMISDTINDRIIEVNMTTKQIVWELDFRNETQVNWSDYADQWGWGINSPAREYAMNQKPARGFWTHLNDFEYINNSVLPGVNSPTIQISIRNFDMLVEVTHNASKMIVWHAGKPRDHSLMNHQHGPSYLNATDTILIADSSNYRCIEINRAGDIVWEYKYPPGFGIFKWVRDIDPLPNGNYLIDDSNNNRIIELDPKTSNIVKMWTLGVSGVPYDADYVPEKNWIIVSNSFMDSIAILDYNTGLILHWIGFPYVLMPYHYLFVAFAVYVGISLFQGIKNTPEASILRKIKKFQNLNKLIVLICLVFCVIFFKYVLAAWWFALLHPVYEMLPLLHLGLF